MLGVLQHTENCMDSEKIPQSPVGSTIAHSLTLGW